jgi:hypothetical protein
MSDVGGTQKRRDARSAVMQNSSPPEPMMPKTFDYISNDVWKSLRFRNLSYVITLAIQ